MLKIPRQQDDRILGNTMAVSSPCIGICELDAEKQVCTGCFRHIHEIGAWGTASDGQKKRILQKARERKKQFERN